MINVRVDSRDVDRALTALITQLPNAMENGVQSAIASIAGSIEAVLVESIRTDMPNAGIGEFMAKRTRVQVRPIPNGASVVISGIPEAEVDDPEEFNDPDTNLWNTHEFGGVSPSTEGKPVGFFSEKLGRQVYLPMGRGPSRIFKHQGEVRRIVAGLSIKLEAALGAAVSISGTSAVGATLRAAGVRINMTDMVREALSSQGITEGALSDMGITRVVHKTGGQVVYLAKNQGGTSTFFRAKGAGLPTRL